MNSTIRTYNVQQRLGDGDPRLEGYFENGDMEYSVFFTYNQTEGTLHFDTDLLIDSLSMEAPDLKGLDADEEQMVWDLWKDERYEVETDVFDELIEICAGMDEQFPY